MLKRMIVSAINARELESARASRLLHDEVGQVLSAVGLQLEVLKLDFRGASPEIVERIHEIQQMLDQAVGQVRSLSYDLNPSVVDRAGLQSALDRMIGRFQDGFAGQIRLTYEPGLRVPSLIAHAWYKIAELAVDNAVRHASASRIEIYVRMTGRGVVFEIRDDGCGFCPEEVSVSKPGLGLLMIEHHAGGGSVPVDIRSQPGKGTTVRSSWNAT